MKKNGISGKFQTGLRDYSSEKNLSLLNCLKTENLDLQLLFLFDSDFPIFLINSEFAFFADGLQKQCFKCC